MLNCCGTSVVNCCRRIIGLDGWKRNKLRVELDGWKRDELRKKGMFWKEKSNLSVGKPIVTERTSKASCLIMIRRNTILIRINGINKHK